MWRAKKKKIGVRRQAASQRTANEFAEKRNARTAAKGNWRKYTNEAGHGRHSTETWAQLNEAT